MSEILVIEDDQEKLRRILQAFSMVPGIEVDSIDVARDVVTAQRAMKEKTYDLAVLDLYLPIRSSQAPSENAGLELLQEIHERQNIYKVPREVVGLTAFEKLRDTAVPVFEEHLSTIIIYDVTSDEWAEKLRRRASAIVSKREEHRDRSTFLCVVTALPDLELAAVRRLDWDWKPLQTGEGSTNYFEGFVDTTKGRMRVVAASTPRMGMVPAAVLATKMVYEFRPKFLAMTGIMAGVQGECKLGDVIAAELCWDWGSGKHCIVDGKPEFEQAPYQYRLDPRLRSKVERVRDDHEALARLKNAWSGSSVRSDIKVHLGPVASGAAVLADDQMMAALKEQHRKVVGVDMEAYSIFAACEETIIPEPRAIVIKGVSDFGGDDKAVNSQREYAAHVGAGVLDILIRKHL